MDGDPLADAEGVLTRGAVADHDLAGLGRALARGHLQVSAEPVPVGQTGEHRLVVAGGGHGLDVGPAHRLSEVPDEGALSEHPPHVDLGLGRALEHRCRRPGRVRADVQ